MRSLPRKDFHLAKVWKLGCWSFFEHLWVSKEEETQPWFQIVLVLVICFEERRGETNIHAY